MILVPRQADHHPHPLCTRLQPSPVLAIRSLNRIRRRFIRHIHNDPRILRSTRQHSSALLLLSARLPREFVTTYLSPQLPRALAVLTQELSIDIPIRRAEHSTPARFATLQLLLLRACGYAV